LKPNLKNKNRYLSEKNIKIKDGSCLLLIIAIYFLAVGMYEAVEIIHYLISATLSIIAVHFLIVMGCNKVNASVSNKANLDQGN
jgi:hypothetical protein